MIVAATLPLLLENGEKVTTRQIADAAGIAEGTIFRVFDDKDALIHAVVEAALDVGPLEAALQRVDRRQPLEACLEAAITSLQQRVVDIWRLFSSLSPRFRDRKTHHPPDLEELVHILEAHAVELALTPRDAARFLRALTLSATHPMLVDAPMAPPEIVSLFLHGVSRSGRC